MAKTLADIVVLVFAAICLCIHCSVAQDPCQSYNSFPDLEKRDVNFFIPDTEKSLSDEFIDSGNKWYGEEGYQVATSPPPGQGYCGASFPMWIKDKLPLKGEEVVTACVVDVGDNCTDPTVQLQVKACDGYHVYKLAKPPFPEVAYCVHLIDPSKPISKYTVKPSVELDLVTDTSHQDSFIFKCYFTSSKEPLRYSIHWHVNGYFLTSFRSANWSSDLIDDTALTEAILTHNGYKTPGFNLECMVKASLGVGFPAGKGILSEKKFIGIIVEPGALTVNEGEEATINLTLSVPFGCAGRTRGCRLDVHAMTRDPLGSCDPSSFVESKCGVTFRDWREMQEMSIKGKITPGYNAKQTTMKFFLSTGEHVLTHPFWSNYDIGSIAVLVNRTSAVNTQKYCYANTDPHMRTFDNRTYNFQKQRGTFILYRHNELDIEVQMKIESCRNGHVAQCPCGLAARVGRTIFRIDSCSGKQAIIGYADCLDGKDLLRVFKKDRHYKIYLPTATRIEVTASFKNFYCVRLYPSNEDENRVTGLCGNFNHNANDDYRGNRMYTELRAKVDLFNDNNFRKLNQWQSTFGVCTCDVLIRNPGALDSSVTCSRTDAHPCTFDDKFRPPPTHNRACAIEIGRRRRSALHARVNRVKRDVQLQSDERTWTNDEATTYCDTFFNKSKSATLCADIPGMTNIIDDNKANCVLDILATGGTSFALDALESAKILCMNEVQLNSTLQEESEPGVASVYEALLEVTCENECSGRGTCVNGSCECEEGFASSDCSRDKSVPPLILGMDLDGHCDVATETCNETALIGDYFDEFAQIRCRFVPFKIFADKSDIKEQPSESTPLIESFSEAICVLPTSTSTSKRKRSATPTVPEDAVVASGYKISIANYGDVFSEESSLVLYNSQCQDCNVTGHLVSCVFTSKSCIVGTQCVPHGETHPENPCFTCDASKPTRKWLRKFDPPCTMEKGNYKLWIIGAVIGGLLLATLVIVLTVVLLKKGKSRKVTDTPRGSAFLSVK